MSNPLVSVLVITYNSADYVVYTLDSIKNQTYANIEIIVSDDGSRDNTVEIVEQWKRENSSEQLQVTIITVEKNTGISANLQRGVDQCKGEWVKLIAGDDCLNQDCIEYYLKQAEAGKCECFLSQMKMDIAGVVSDYVDLESERQRFFSLSTERQYNYFLISPIFLNTPSLFIKRRLFNELPVINLKYKLLEDQPLFYNLLKNNIEIKYCNYSTVTYRRHAQSLTAEISVRFYKNLYEAFEEYRKKELSSIAPLYCKLVNLHFLVVTKFPKSSILYKGFLKILRTPINTQKEKLLEETTKQYSIN
jgi:glycosyltransferase involved in cell wall biosynthesis